MTGLIPARIAFCLFLVRNPIQARVSKDFYCGRKRRWVVQATDGDVDYLGVFLVVAGDVGSAFRAEVAGTGF